MNNDIETQSLSTTAEKVRSMYDINEAWPRIEKHYETALSFSIRRHSQIPIVRTVSSLMAIMRIYRVLVWKRLAGIMKFAEKARLT